MAFRRSTVHDVADRDPDLRDTAYEEVEDRPARAAMVWSPAQLVGLIAGIGFAILGVAAIADTGFDTSHIYTPQEEVWRLPHSPLLGVIEIGFGLLLMMASVVPGALRSLMALLGAGALAFGLVILLDVAPNRLNKWFAVNDSNGWLFTIVGAVVLIAGMFSPVFTSGRSRRRTSYAARSNDAFTGRAT